jgi:hypothetical protein
MRALVLAAALMLAPPLAARACDTAAMNAELTRVCRAALDPVLGWLARLAPEPEEAAALARASAAAAEACDTGDPAAGVLEAARLARLAGRIEARTGDAPPVWPARHAAAER